MGANLQALLEEIRDLEMSVVEQIKQKEEDLLYSIKNRTVVFRKEIIEKHKALRKSVYRFLVESSSMSYVVAPVIYSMIIPALIMDIFVSVYQRICFPVYGIPKVKRNDYIVLDRNRLKYLNWIERINCDYCGYFNGLISYVREVASRTEQYFCPIRHALKVKGLHIRHARFLRYGEVDNYRERLAQLRKEVRETALEV
ncbi:MAG: hypothetical protein AB7N80_06910 [Bdellovibrionales bacterium]